MDVEYLDLGMLDVSPPQAIIDRSASSKRVVARAAIAVFALDAVLLLWLASLY